MKKALFLSVLILALAAALHAQVPQAVTLQSVLRDATGRLVASQNIAVRLTLTQRSTTGTVIYRETHAATTNPYGLYSVLLGQGTPSQGVFSAIDWGNGPYFLTVEADPAGGTAYSLSVVQPLVSVPYALYADTASRVAQATTAFDAAHATNADHSTISDNATNARHADTARFYQERQVLTRGNDTIYLTGGSFVVLPPSSNANITGRYIDSVIRANNSTIVNHYVDSVVRASNTTVVNNYIDSVIRANNSTIVNRYVDSVVRASNTTVVNNIDNHIADSLRHIRATLRDTITSTIRDSIISVMRDSATVVQQTISTMPTEACYASCGSVDSLRRRNDSVYRAFDSIVSVQNITLRRYDSVINIQRRDIHRYDSIIRTFDSVVATYDSIISGYDSVVTHLVHTVDSVTNSTTTNHSALCSGRNTTGVDVRTATRRLVWIDGNTYTSSTNTPTYVLRNANVAGCDSMVTLNLTITNNIVTDGCLYGVFSVSPTSKVKFSQGNLQYQPSTQTWRFALNQYDNLADSNGKYDGRGEYDGREQYRDDYTGWIDLFGWGTSGYNLEDPYNTQFMPISKSSSGVNDSYNKYGYGPSVNRPSPDLTGYSANLDWGIYNAISNGGNMAGVWRTPTYDEVRYLFFLRPTSGVIGDCSNARFCRAKVNGITGLILFPDNYSHPASVAIPYNTNKSNAFYGDAFALWEWELMEEAGAVFLPTTGYYWNRYTSISYYSYDHCSFYWTSTHYDATEAYLYGGNNASGGDIIFTGPRYYGCSVRLIQDINE